VTAVVGALALFSVQLAVWTARHVSRERLAASLRSRA